MYYSLIFVYKKLISKQIQRSFLVNWENLFSIYLKHIHITVNIFGKIYVCFN